MLSESDRPQRRTAFVVREPGAYGIDVAALSETRFAKVGEITKKLALSSLSF